MKKIFVVAVNVVLTTVRQTKLVITVPNELPCQNISFFRSLNLPTEKSAKELA